MLSHTSRQSETVCDHRDVETTPAPSLEASLNVTNIGKGWRACDKLKLKLLPHLNKHKQMRPLAFLFIDKISVRAAVFSDLMFVKYSFSCPP